MRPRRTTRKRPVTATPQFLQPPRQCSTLPMRTAPSLRNRFSVSHCRSAYVIATPKGVLGGAWLPRLSSSIRSCCMRRSGGLLSSPQALVRIAVVLVGAPLDLVKLLNQLQRTRRAQVTGLECSHEFPSSMRQTSRPLGRALLLKQAAQARVTITLQRALKVLQQLLNMHSLPVRSVLKEYNFIVADKRPDMPAFDSLWMRRVQHLNRRIIRAQVQALQSARAVAWQSAPAHQPLPPAIPRGWRPTAAHQIARQRCGSAAQADSDL